MDAWQAALEDVGPAGVDKGKGGKYLILPPDYTDKAPNGYIVRPSTTYQGYALLRSILKSGSDADVANAAAYARQIKLYPLSQADNPPPTIFVDAIDVVYDATIPYDVRFFQSLDRVVQIEPWLTRDKVMIDMLKSIGIEKGKPFNPDPKTKDILNAAAREAQAWLDARYEAGYPSFYEGRQWAFPASAELAETMGTFYEKPDAYSVAARGLASSLAYSTIKHLGEGQFYLTAAKDKDGRALEGAKNYRLNVPADAPVKQYWSATLCDRATHALIRDVSRAGRSSQSPGLQKNRMARWTSTSRRKRRRARNREALALGLDRDDTVIRRQLRLKMQFISEDFAPRTEPTEDELRAFLAKHADRFQSPSRVSFTQVYLSPDHRGEDAWSDAERLLVVLSGGTSDPAEAGDPFLLEQDYRDLAQPDVERLFGQAFAVRVGELPVGRRTGPVASGYGLHLVLVRERTPARLPELAEVRDAVANVARNPPGGGEPSVLRSAARALRGHLQAHAIGR
jgi:hypothetical protein